MADITVTSFTRTIAADGVAMTLRWVRATGAWSAPVKVGNATLTNVPDGGAGPTHATLAFSWAAPSISTTTNPNDTVTIVATLSDRKAMDPDTLTLSGPQGLITDGTDTTPAFTAQAVTNNSTQTYLRPSAAKPCWFCYYPPSTLWDDVGAPDIWTATYSGSDHRKWVTMTQIFWENLDRADQKFPGFETNYEPSIGVTMTRQQAAAKRCADKIQAMWEGGILPQGDGYCGVFIQRGGSGASLTNKLFEHTSDQIAAGPTDRVQHFYHDTGRTNHREDIYGTIGDGSDGFPMLLLAELEDRDIPVWPGFMFQDIEDNPLPHVATAGNFNGGGVQNWPTVKLEARYATENVYLDPLASSMTVEDIQAIIGDPPSYGDWRASARVAWSRDFLAWSLQIHDQTMDYCYYGPMREAFPNCNCSNYRDVHGDNIPTRYRNTFGVDDGSDLAIYPSPDQFIDGRKSDAERPLLYPPSDVTGEINATTSVFMAQTGFSLGWAWRNAAAQALDSAWLSVNGAADVFPEMYVFNAASTSDGANGTMHATFDDDTVWIGARHLRRGGRIVSQFCWNARAGQTETDWDANLAGIDRTLVAAGITP